VVIYTALQVYYCLSAKGKSLRCYIIYIFTCIQFILFFNIYFYKRFLKIKIYTILLLFYV